MIEIMRRRITRFNIFSLIILSIFTWYTLTLIAYFYRDNGKKIQNKHARISVEEKFSSIANPAGIKLIIIDPHRLFDSLSVEDKILLQRHNFNLNEYSNKITTFGIFEEDGKQLDKISSYFLQQNFRVTIIKDVDPREKRIQNPNIVLEKKAILHRFYTLNHFVIHVVTFFRRSNYFWHGKVSTVPRDVSKIIGDSLQFGRHEGAFERFQLELFLHNGIDYYAPQDRIYFLFEMTTSNFVDCNFESAWEFFIQYQNISVPSIEFARAFIEAIQELKNQFREKLIPVWIASGTLLGWYRQCSIIPYTHDVDLAAWIKDFDPSLIDHLNSNSKTMINAILGMPEDSLQFIFNVNNLKVDLFFTYKEENYFWYGGHVVQEGYRFKYVYPKFELCSAELLYQKVLVPCDSEAIVSSEYGPNWQIPIPVWNYEYSSYNVKDKKFWTNEQRNKSFYVFAQPEL